MRFYATLFCAAFMVISGPTCRSSQTPEEIHRDWVARANSFIGHSKSDVVSEIGQPWWITPRDKDELWAYLYTYGSSRLRRNRVVYLVFSGDRLVSLEEAWAQ
jgi:hypothetical protein